MTKADDEDIEFTEADYERMVKWFEEHGTALQIPKIKPGRPDCQICRGRGWIWVKEVCEGSAGRVESSSFPMPCGCPPGVKVVYATVE